MWTDFVMFVCYYFLCIEGRSTSADFKGKAWFSWMATSAVAKRRRSLSAVALRRVHDRKLLQQPRSRSMSSSSPWRQPQRCQSGLYSNTVFILIIIWNSKTLSIYYIDNVLLFHHHIERRNVFDIIAQLLWEVAVCFLVLFLKDTEYDLTVSIIY